MTIGSLSPDSAITWWRGLTACTRRATAATRCSGLWSKIAWMASSRSPSIPKSRTQPSALWHTHSRTGSDSASSKFIALPQGVAYFSVKYGPNASMAAAPDAPRWL